VNFSDMKQKDPMWGGKNPVGCSICHEINVCCEMWKQKYKVHFLVVHTKLWIFSMSLLTKKIEELKQLITAQ